MRRQFLTANWTGAAQKAYNLTQLEPQLDGRLWPSLPVWDEGQAAAAGPCVVRGMCVTLYSCLGRSNEPAVAGDFSSLPGILR